MLGCSPDIGLYRPHPRPTPKVKAQCGDEPEYALESHMLLQIPKIPPRFNPNCLACCSACTRAHAQGAGAVTGMQVTRLGHRPMPPKPGLHIGALENGVGGFSVISLFCEGEASNETRAPLQE